jgi:6,7-dimethyl-8-ribityllumazine synthase
MAMASILWVNRQYQKDKNMAKFLIVEARFYDHLNDMLVAGASAALKAAGHEVEVITVPGALEIPGAIALASESDQYDGYVAIGVVIRGETYHFEIVAGESARGIMALTMDGLAIGNGILTVENEEQALVRADPAQKDKGGEAAVAAMKLLELRSHFG